MEKQNHQPRGLFTPYMKHYAETTLEQIEKNKPLMEKLKKWIEESKTEEITEEEAKAREEYWEEFKKNIDSFRPKGHKLYTPE